MSVRENRKRWREMQRVCESESEWVTKTIKRETDRDREREAKYC